jgi:hypothetical protein
MKIRAKRLLIGCSLFLLIAVIALGVLEWDRRRQAAAAPSEALDGSGVAVSAREWEERYRDPKAFARLCAEVTARCDALQRRYLHLQHTRKTRQTRYDEKGEAVAISESIYRVHFVDGVERKEEIEHRQIMGKSSFFDPDKIKLEQVDTHLSSPFSKDSPDGLYRYRLEGVEELRGRHLLRLHFEPTRPVERTFKGSAWIDPDTREPMRISGALAKAKFSVDRFDLLLDYGSSENGCNQLRRIVMDVAGGFALLSLHYRIDSKLSDYREVEE